MAESESVKENEPAVFHKLYGPRGPRVTFYKKDFLDYLLMIALSAFVLIISYGPRHVMTIAGVALCVLTLATFVVRHGVELRVPVLLRRPQDVLYMAAYKLRNLKPAYFIALGLLLLENALIAATPNLPHHVDGMRIVAIYLFYIHILVITAYRTRILIDHLRKKDLIREVLSQTAWKRVVAGKRSITLEIVHAYTTGILTHIIMIAPWYLIIRYASFSVIFLPVVCLMNVGIHLKWMRGYNRWFYRDHWLGHNSELEFLYLHGTHHDAIPSGLIAVAENGFLEGYLRFTIGWPLPFYNPVICFGLLMYDVKNDIELHQYIPGVYPRLSRRVMEVFQHSTHHYGSLEPYSVGAGLDRPGVTEAFKKRFRRVPDEIMNSIRLDEELNGFKWDNPTYRRTLSLYDQYQVSASVPDDQRDLVIHNTP
jgi:hypothetical protein